MLVSLFSDPKFATGSSIMLNSGTLVYQPGVVTAALAGSDQITYTVSDAITGAVTQKTQTVTLSAGSPPIVTLAVNPADRVQHHHGSARHRGPRRWAATRCR